MFMKKISLQYLIILFNVVVFINPVNSLANICKNATDNFYYPEKSVIKSSYFEKYLLGKKSGIYYIHAIKTTSIDFLKLVDVLENMEKYSEFMTGYESVNVQQTGSNKFLTRIDFISPFFNISSRFTNEVEIIKYPHSYQQCWNQLADDDSRITGKNKNSPLVNYGFWELQNRGIEGTRISYHLAIKPPISMPLFIYKMLVKRTYVRTFDRILKRADSL